jgi:hypothetical protein
MARFGKIEELWGKAWRLWTKTPRFLGNSKRDRRIECEHPCTTGHICTDHGIRYLASVPGCRTCPLKAAKCCPDMPARRIGGPHPVGLYSFHVPEVECVGKGKASAPYEFGVKVSIVTTNARAPSGPAADGRADDLLFGGHGVFSNPPRRGASQPRPLRA